MTRVFISDLALPTEGVLTLRKMFVKDITFVDTLAECDFVVSWAYSDAYDNAPDFFNVITIRTDPNATIFHRKTSVHHLPRDVFTVQATFEIAIFENDLVSMQYIAEHRTSDDLFAVNKLVAQLLDFGIFVETAEMFCAFDGVGPFKVDKSGGVDNRPFPHSDSWRRNHHDWTRMRFACVTGLFRRALALLLEGKEPEKCPGSSRAMSALMGSAALPWSRKNHALYPASKRDLALLLLVVQHRLTKQCLAVWQHVLLPMVVTRQ